MSSFEALAITVALVIASMAYFGASGKLWKGGKKQPPLAPGGMWKHTQMATSSQFPWWMLVRFMLPLLSSLYVLKSTDAINKKSYLIFRHCNTVIRPYHSGRHPPTPVASVQSFSSLGPRDASLYSGGA